MAFAIKRCTNNYYLNSTHYEANCTIYYTKIHMLIDSQFGLISHMTNEK